MGVHTFCILVLFNICVNGASAEYYVHNADTNWSVTSPPCTLATPIIDYNDGYNMINASRLPNIHGDDQIAVGYIMQGASFEILGCAITNATPNHTTQSDPGQCHSACKSPYFGIFNHNCYCLNDRLDKDKEVECSAECDELGYGVCGRYTHKHTYISIYKYSNLVDNATNDNGNCKQYKYGSKNFRWENCNKDVKGLCSPEPTHVGSGKWREFPTKCFQLDKHPTTKDELDNLNKSISGGWLWIAEMKSSIIATLAESANTGMDRYGYIEKDKIQDKGQYHLKFTEPGENLKLKLLCVNESITTVPSVTTEDMSDRSTFTATTNLPFTNNTASIGLVAVYVAVPLIVVAIAAVVLLVLLRKMIKRKQDGKHPQPNEYSSGIQSSGQGAKMHVSNATYEKDFDVSKSADANIGHDYFVLEASNEYADINDLDLENSNDTEYDTTRTLPNKKRDGGNDGNVYNTLEDKAEDTYNNTADRKGNDHHGTGDVYNHISNDDEYSTTDVPTDGKATFADTYSHIQQGV